MKKLKLISLFLVLGSLGLNAQDLNQVKKAIDAEQYQKAKSILKELISKQPDKGENYFHLGNVYLTLENADSAKIVLNKGVNLKDKGHLNLIGLGQIDLDNANVGAAQLNFAKATENIKKKDTEELLYIGKAFINSDNPDYKKAIESLTKAVSVDAKNAQAHLALGDAYFKDGNVNQAFASYREALSLDKNLTRAKLQMAVITKNAKAFQEAVKSFNEIVNSNKDYGPVYRELAETYNFWAYSDPAKFNEHNKKALEYYRQYMNLTDSSLDSKMRYADFLILTKEYKELENQANEMQKLENVNPRIYRYLGYAAFENGNYQESINAMNNFFEKIGNGKIISRDYAYLGKALIYQATNGTKTTITDQKLFDQGIAELSKSTSVDADLAQEFSDLGIELYKSKQYLNAGKVFGVSTKNNKSKTYVLDNFYLGNSVLFYMSNLDMDKLNSEELSHLTMLVEKANLALDVVIKNSPKTQDAYLNKAKINRLLNTEESKVKSVASYEDYINVVLEKGTQETSQAKVKRELVNAYSFLGSYYSQSDKVKAKENFKNALNYEPSDADKNYILQSLDVIK